MAHQALEGEVGLQKRYLSGKEISYPSTELTSSRDLMRTTATRIKLVKSAPNPISVLFAYCPVFRRSCESCEHSLRAQPARERVKDLCVEFVPRTC